VLVTALLTATTNAYFYIAWMVAGFVFIIPASLTLAVYAVGAHNPAALSSKLRFSILLSAALGTLANAGLLLAAPPVLGLFGRTYAEQALPALRLLGLGVYPLLVRDHYVVISRLQGRVGFATALVGGGACLELCAAAAGGTAAGLTGLILGWLLAMGVEAVIMGPAVFRASLAPAAPAAPSGPACLLPQEVGDARRR
jgi:hypothetical protein